MPNCKSAKKRQRQSLEDRSRNRAVKSALKTALRKARELAASGKADEVEKLVPALAKQLDQAAAKRIIHFNKASRLKSRLVHMITSNKSPDA
jgi:small subunit ribosomal protein S20